MHKVISPQPIESQNAPCLRPIYGAGPTAGPGLPLKGYPGGVPLPHEQPRQSGSHPVGLRLPWAGSPLPVPGRPPTPPPPSAESRGAIQ